MVTILKLAHCETLLKNVTDCIAKCDSYFIRKCNKILLQYVLRFLLQFPTAVLQNVMFITKCIGTSLFAECININFE